MWERRKIAQEREGNRLCMYMYVWEGGRRNLRALDKVKKSEIKEQSGGFLSMLLGTLGASLLGSLLSGKGLIRAGEGVFRAGDQDFY